MKSLNIVLVICLFVFGQILQDAVAEVLEDSGYPMKGANPQRNYQSNRKVLCSSVAPGRSQVLNWKWTFPPTTDSGLQVLNSDITTDASGNVYATVTDYTTNFIVKLNGTDGTLFPKNLTLPDPFGLASMTRVQGNKMYYGTPKDVYIVDSTTMSFVGDPIQMPTFVDTIQASFAPYLSTHMITSNQDLSPDASDNLLTYIKVSDLTIDSTKANFAGGNPLPVLIYKSDLLEIPIVVVTNGSFPDYSTRVISPQYEKLFNGEYVDRAWIEGNYLQMFTRGSVNQNAVKYYVFDAATGASLLTKSIDEVLGSQFNLLSPMYAINNRSIVQVYSTANLQTEIVDLLNNQTYLPETQYNTLPSAPMYSKPDNTLLMHSAFAFGRIDLIGVDWDTLEINTKGSFPADNIFSDFILSPPIIGEDCHVYSMLNARLFAFAPLPIQNIVPILECVDQNGQAYFSYDNLGDIDATIPQLSDRNNISPLNVTPGVDFGAERRGKYFPLSFRISIGSSGTFTWQLEDYVLTFDVNSTLLCPQNVRFRIVLTAIAPFPVGFDEPVRLLFASVVGINETRVTFLQGKRSTEQLPSTDLELALQVAPDETQTELSPEEAVQTFVEQQLSFFNSQLPNLPDAPPEAIIKDVDGLPLSTEIKGEIPPQPPQTVPISTPVTAPTPVNVPQTTTVPTKVSSSSCIGISILAMLVSVIVASN